MLETVEDDASKAQLSSLGVFSFRLQENTTLGFVTEWSTTPNISNNSNSFTTKGSGFLKDEIEANDLTSRFNYAYSFLFGLGLLAGCILIYSFIKTYKASRPLAWLDCLISAFCGLQLFLLLLSLHMVAYRPDYLRTTGLGCAALSFTINITSLCSLLILVLMAYVLTLDPPSYALLRKPSVCTALVILTSVLVCLLLAGLRGPRSGLLEECICYMDPVRVSYTSARLFLAFLMPYILQLGLLIRGCVQQLKSKGRFLSGCKEGPLFLAVTSVTFVCQLFYSVVLSRAAHLGRDPSYKERAFLSMAEFVLFSGSSASLLFVLFLHNPCRESLHSFYRRLKDCCQSPGRSQPNRNIIAPHIEITDTLQDIES